MINQPPDKKKTLPELSLKKFIFKLRTAPGLQMCCYVTVDFATTKSQNASVRYIKNYTMIASKLKKRSQAKLFFVTL
jgi:hypothetical protein